MKKKSNRSPVRRLGAAGSDDKQTNISLDYLRSISASKLNSRGQIEAYGLGLISGACVDIGDSARVSQIPPCKFNSDEEIDAYSAGVIQAAEAAVARAMRPTSKRKTMPETSIFCRFDK